jgi:predicted HAD superfamily phosphohydrolase YqeG
LGSDKMKILLADQLMTDVVGAAFAERHSSVIAVLRTAQFFSAVTAGKRRWLFRWNNYIVHQ